MYMWCNRSQLKFIHSNGKRYMWIPKRCHFFYPMVFIFREKCHRFHVWVNRKRNALFRKAENDTHTGRGTQSLMLCYVIQHGEHFSSASLFLMEVKPYFSQFVFFSATSTVKIFSSAWTNMFPQFKVKATKSFQFMHQMISTSKHQRIVTYTNGSNKCIRSISNRIAKMKR